MADVTAAAGNEVNIRRVIRAPKDKVFHAWTNAADVEKWWGPGPVTCPSAHFDLSLGGRYHIANLDPDGTVTTVRGEFERIDAPHKLVYSWFMNAQPVGKGGSRVTVEFLEHAEGTEIVIRHERIATPEMAENHRLGWEGCLDGLAEFFQAGQAA
ncbi:MAG TPA: SRPBCC family protein [Devosiaceae bacterium]|nr:SRPBCC family protein [Devosiaceae bacterium]